MLNKKQEELWNENIPFKEFLVISQNGENLGVMKKEDALALVESLKLDLLCISPQAKMPVCKIVNFDRYRFETEQKEKMKRKTQRASIIKEKEIRLTTNIGLHDLKFKAKQARDFLLKGDKVKVSLRYRGREIEYKELGFEKLRMFYQEVSDIAVCDKNLDNLAKYKIEGNYFSIYLTLNTKEENSKEV